MLQVLILKKYIVFVIDLIVSICNYDEMYILVQMQYCDVYVVGRYVMLRLSVRNKKLLIRL